MTTRKPGWFGPSNHRLFGWLHAPTDEVVRGGVVLCPPLDTEYYASQQTYSELADQLAEAGFVALRFDYFGTGDSEGEPADVEHLGLWLDNVRQALRHLRQAGAPRLGLLGLRMGATIAAAVGDEECDFLVLWDPCLSGRGFMREAMLLMQQDPWNGIGTETYDEKGSHQLVGYPYPDEFITELSALRLSPQPRPPTLLLTRNGQLPSQLSRWADNGLVEVGEAPGQDDLVGVPLTDVISPQRTQHRIVEWCSGFLAEQGAPYLPESALHSTVHELSGKPVTEEALCVGEYDLFAIITEPATSPVRLNVLLFNSGLQHHIGPHRMYVDLARRLAADGVRSVRLDFSGIGDSPNRPSYPPRIVHSPAAFDDMDLVLKTLVEEGSPVALVGLCSGGYHALEGAFLAPVIGICAVHVTFNYELGSWLESENPGYPRRKIWVQDRPWLNYINGFRWPRALTRRLPAIAWKVLEVLRLQRSPTAGALALADTGTEVVLICEERVLGKARLQELVHSRNPNIKVLSSGADHSVVDHTRRKAVADVVREQILTWRQHAPAS